MTIATKKPLNLSLPRAIRERVQDGKQLSGQAWPCTVVAVDGAIVTVVFEVSSDFTLPQATCPIAEPFYIRIPVQEGDQGMVMAASTRLGGVTGLGAGLAPTGRPRLLARVWSRVKQAFCDHAAATSHRIPGAIPRAYERRCSRCKAHWSWREET